jgi:RsiW-degrading membrane proteinase PrsW (M82 family)
VSAVSQAEPAVIRTATRWMVFRRWSWLPVLVVGAVFYELVRLTLEGTGDPLYVPTLLLLGAAVVPVAFIAFVYGRRLAFGVRGSVVTLTALLGGVVGVIVAGWLEFETQRMFGGPPFFAVGLIEEMAKLLVPAAMLLVVGRNRRPADGLLLGVAAGAGFAVLETMGYALVALVGSAGNLSVVNGLLLDRGLLSPAAHMAWTGLAGVALWRAATERWRFRAVARFVVVYLVVVALHTGWDATAGGWPHAGLAVASLSMLLWTTHRLAMAASRERSGLPGPGRAYATDSLPGGQPVPERPTMTPVLPAAAARSSWLPVPPAGPGTPV